MTEKKINSQNIRKSLTDYLEGKNQVLIRAEFENKSLPADEVLDALEDAYLKIKEYEKLKIKYDNLIEEKVNRNIKEFWKDN